MPPETFKLQMEYNPKPPSKDIWTPVRSRMGFSPSQNI